MNELHEGRITVEFLIVMCPKCGAAWDVSQAGLFERIRTRHPDSCEGPMSDSLIREAMHP